MLFDEKRVGVINCGLSLLYCRGGISRGCCCCRRIRHSTSESIIRRRQQLRTKKKPAAAPYRRQHCRDTDRDRHTHTHAHTYIIIILCFGVCVCESACAQEIFAACQDLLVGACKTVLPNTILSLST